ncbi:MAG TPA: response regulator [Candidatus Gastranaerophilales bacterium]|nr:response regulator [Candidatus Gastranaerophilales bacterium]
MFLMQFIMIFDAKKEQTAYIKSVLENDSFVRILNTDNLPEGFETIEKFEPDIIIVHDNFKEDITQICSKIRQKTSLYRPVLMILSGVESVERKIEILQAGADDYHHESIDAKELSLRIFAHLRRRMEELTDPSTKLFGATVSYRILKRKFEMDSGAKYSLMYIDIDNFEPYRETYGHIASDRLLQTFIAIIRTALNDNDFLGRVGMDEFVIFTSPEKAEKIAVFLSYSFDMVAQKFYTNEDINRGYLILNGDEKLGRRIPFVSVSIGIVSNKHKTFESFEELVNNAMDVHRIAKFKTGSYWISDRLKISGSEEKKDYVKRILIVENDAALTYLLVTTLEMQGYVVEAISSSDQVIETIQKTEPHLVIFDTGMENTENELEICDNIKKNHSNIRLIVTTVKCAKEKILNTGADLYIPKPYELMTLFSWISRLLNYEIL